MEKAELESLLSRIDIWLLVFGIVVVIGVAGESFFGIRHWWNSRKLASIQNLESMALKAEIERLGHLTAEANARADADRLELAKFKAPRVLTADQEAYMVAALKPFVPTEIDVCAYPNDPEIVGITNQIITVLRRPGWTPRLFLVTEYTRSVSGMLVETDPGATEPMTALVTALKAQGLVVAGPVQGIQIGQQTGQLATFMPGPGTKADWMQNPVGSHTPGFWVIIGERLIIGKKP